MTLSLNAELDADRDEYIRMKLYDKVNAAQKNKNDQLDAAVAEQKEKKE